MFKTHIKLSLLIIGLVLLVTLATPVSAAEYLRTPTGAMRAGSGLLETPDTTALAGGASRSYSPLVVRNASKVHIDLIADQAITVTVYRLPDADDTTRIGAAYEETIVVPAGGGADYGWVEAVGCYALKIMAENTSGSATTDYWLSVRVSED